MKKIINLCIAAILFALVSCSTVPAGHVGVKVYLLGGDKGVSSEQLGVGRYWIGYNEQLFTFPTFTQNYVYTEQQDEGKAVDESITFQTVESMSIHTNVGVAYHIEPTNAVKVFQKYREGTKEITAGPLRNEIRNAMNDIASTYTVENILGKDKVAFMNATKQRVVVDMAKIGITIEDVYLVGKLTPPENIEHAINAKMQAQQNALRAQQDIQTAIAEAKRDSIVATGHAKAQNQLKMALTPELLQKMWIDKWDGHLPQTQLGAGSNTLFTIK